MARTRQADHASTLRTRRTREEYLASAASEALRGFDLPQTKVPPLAIIAIREAARKREQMRREITARYSNAALAKQWGVHVRTIEKIIAYETGAHLP
jgi:hypothetical protein